MKKAILSACIIGVLSSQVYAANTTSQIAPKFDNDSVSIDVSQGYSLYNFDGNKSGLTSLQDLEKLTNDGSATNQNAKKDSVNCADLGVYFGTDASDKIGEKTIQVNRDGQTVNAKIDEVRTFVAVDGFKQPTAEACIAEFNKEKANHQLGNANSNSKFKSSGTTLLYAKARVKPQEDVLYTKSLKVDIEKEKEKVSSKVERDLQEYKDTLDKAYKSQISANNKVVTVKDQALEFKNLIDTLIKSYGGRVDGKLNVSLLWFSGNDLDIHYYDNTNNHIYYNNKEGILDVDSNAGCGYRNPAIENINTPRNIELRDGDYRFKVVQYATCNWNLDQKFTNGGQNTDRFFLTINYRDKQDKLHMLVLRYIQTPYTNSSRWAYPEVKINKSNDNYKIYFDPNTYQVIYNIDTNIYNTNSNQVVGDYRKGVFPPPRIRDKILWENDRTVDSDGTTRDRCDISKWVNQKGKLVAPQGCSGSPQDVDVRYQQ